MADRIYYTIFVFIGRGRPGYGYKKASIVPAKIIMVLSAMGMAFNGFIIYREIRYINAYCLLCLICTAIIITIFILSLSMVRGAKSSSGESVQ